ncbi:MAG: HAD-IIA family hydrolase [candidate division Zixibacteria bacterium]|nr:HAD-IIA family hydrolase [candidate division Zixibacteria bacterium]
MKYKHFLIDIEGTLVKDKTFTPVENAVSWIEKLNENDCEYFLVTNNTTHTPEQLYTLMADSGFNVRADKIVSCISAGGDYLVKNNCRKCFVIGSQAIKSHLKSRGIEVVNSPNLDAVVVGLDEDLNYDKLRIATTALVQHGALLCGMHKNRLFVDKLGRISFSSGPIVKALEYASGKRAYIAGKPSPHFFRKFLSIWNIAPQKILMVSDDPYSDLQGAKKMGMSTCFVTSGIYPDSSIVENIEIGYRPDYIFKTVASIEI